MAGCPGKWGLPLVLSGDLKKVEEVCACRVDGDEVLIWRGSWIGQISYFELLRPLEILLAWGCQMHLCAADVPRRIW